MEPIPRRLAIGRSTLLLLCSCLLLAACSSGGSAQTTAQTAAYQTAVKTSDQQFVDHLSLTPNRLGLNTFTVKVENAATGQAVSSLQVRLATTMLDMDMGTNQLALNPDGPGQYSAQASLAMAGHWEIQILFDTPGAILHQAAVKLDVAP